MKTWWEFGEHSGRSGSDLALYSITCGFCLVRGQFELLHRLEKKSPEKNKTLNYDIYKCCNCGNYTMVFWSASMHFSHGGRHDFHSMPWARELTQYPEHWPQDIGRFWLQAKRSLSASNWDAAAVMARSAMQAALRRNDAVGKRLVDEIDDLANKGLLPPIMREWSHELRVLGNESAHPAPGDAPITKSSARDVVNFLDYLLQYLYTLPHNIAQYRERKKGE